MLRFLVRTALVFALIGVAAHEVGQIVFAQTRVEDAATEAASAGQEMFLGTHNVAKAEEEAAGTALEEGARLTSFDVLVDGTVVARASVTARTLIVRHLSFLERFGIRKATEEAAQPS